MKKFFAPVCAAAAMLPAAFLAGCDGLVSGGKYERYDDAPLYSVEAGSVAAVTTIDIEWAAGAVIVETSKDAAEISFSESGLPENADEGLKLHYLSRAGELDIEFTASRAKLPSDFSKTLTVTVPESLSLYELDIKTVSADVTVYAAGREVAVETGSGNVDFVLGDIGGFVLEYETRSGALSDAYGAQLRERHTYLFGQGGMEIDVETSSGDLTLRKS